MSTSSSSTNATAPASGPQPATFLSQTKNDEKKEEKKTEKMDSASPRTTNPLPLSSSSTSPSQRSFVVAKKKLITSPLPMASFSMPVSPQTSSSLSGSSSMLASPQTSSSMSDAPEMISPSNRSKSDVSEKTVARAKLFALIPELQKGKYFKPERILNAILEENWPEMAKRSTDEIVNSVVKYVKKTFVPLPSDCAERMATIRSEKDDKRRAVLLLVFLLRSCPTDLIETCRHSFEDLAKKADFGCVQRTLSRIAELEEEKDYRTCDESTKNRLKVVAAFLSLFCKNACGVKVLQELQSITMRFAEKSDALKTVGSGDLLSLNEDLAKYLAAHVDKETVKGEFAGVFNEIFEMLTVKAKKSEVKKKTTRGAKRGNSHKETPKTAEVVNIEEDAISPNQQNTGKGGSKRKLEEEEKKSVYSSLAADDGDDLVPSSFKRQSRPHGTPSNFSSHAEKKAKTITASPSVDSLSSSRSGSESVSGRESSSSVSSLELNPPIVSSGVSVEEQIARAIARQETLLKRELTQKEKDVLSQGITATLASRPVYKE